MIEIKDVANSQLSKRFLEKVAQKVLQGEKEKLDISIVLLKQSEIRTINRKYRKKDVPTDVLSFRYDNAGEIALCPFIIRKYAKKLKITFKKNLSLVLIHGILHLVGYDHEKSIKEAKRMEIKQNYYLNKLT
ncbi:MAG: putative rRNA maturation factor [Parcubacteria group bacterium GW2011_GWC1_38_6]|nr:MAG: putative rRNA maturation factor [Parcubacteria group bacterium GW2011_GWC1_38_6]